MAAFVLGNGISRQQVSVDRLLELGAVYGCNGLYRDHTPTVLVATDQPISRVIQESGYSQKHKFYTRRPLPNLGALEVPKQYFGYSSGPIAAGIAAMDGHFKIYLIGFDMGPNHHGKFNNVYAGTDNYKPVGSVPTYTGNWARQIVRIATDFPNCHLVRVHGDTTANIPEFDKVRNLDRLDMAAFLQRINKAKDL